MKIVFKDGAVLETGHGYRPVSKSASKPTVETPVKTPVRKSVDPVKSASGKSSDEIDHLVADEVNKQLIQPNKREAERFERLAKTVSDKELARYYRQRADGMNVIAQALKDAAPAPKPVTPKPAPRTAGANFNQAVRPTDNKLANETARQGLLANAEACDREGKEWDRKASEKMEAVKRVNDRSLVNHYTDTAREYRAHAEMARSRAESFRKAANSLG